MSILLYMREWGVSSRRCHGVDLIFTDKSGASRVGEAEKVTPFLLVLPSKSRYTSESKVGQKTLLYGHISLSIQTSQKKKERKP